MSKTDLNRRCDCGSGKKYKNCCGSSVAAAPRENMDSIHLNMEIAYKGAIGRKREKFCREFTAKQPQVYELISQRQNEMVSANSETISCKKGCAHCCVFFISASVQEAEAIVYHLYHNKELLDHFLKSYPLWRERVRKGGDLFMRSNKADSATAKVNSSAQAGNSILGNLTAYALQGISCPFLINSACSIYEVRPFVCAGLVVTTPCEWCDGSKPSHIKDRKTYTAYERSLFPDVPFYYGKSCELVGSFMPILVNNILTGGMAAISRLPGLEGLENEFMKDPEVQSAIRAFRSR
jgi:Fe-S-cluster containining protein